MHFDIENDIVGNCPSPTPRFARLRSTPSIRRLLVLLACASLAVGLSACSDDDTPALTVEPEPQPESEPEDEPEDDIEVCDDGADNDNDGDVDCDDAECADKEACQEPEPEPEPEPDPEVCDDGQDNDSDGDADCDDADCADEEACQIAACEGACSALSMCPEFAELCPAEFLPVLLGRCQGGCQNPDARAQILAASQIPCAQVVPLALGNLDPEGVCAPEVCDDGVDNNANDLIDCDDEECVGQPACLEVCDDGLDNDSDGDVDCDDADCDAELICQNELLCDNGLDDDLDGDIDCDDFDCFDNDACTEQICDDRQDNDGDGNVDCFDIDCLRSPICTESDCDDGQDSDQDGDVDCDDSDCTQTEVCVGEGSACEAPTPIDGPGQFTGTTEGQGVFSGLCSFGRGGPEDVFSLTLEADSPVCIDTFGTNRDTVLYARAGDCFDRLGEEACNDDIDFGNTESQIQILGTTGQTYFIFVDAFGSDAGDYTLNVSFTPCFELVCGDGLDDDQDGAIDCDDDDCAGADACAESICDDGLDDDGDGDADCDDFDCFDNDACTEQTCDDGLDEDNDGDIDCADDDCFGVDACVESICDDGQDNDGDDDVDCNDSDCAGDPTCAVNSSDIAAPGGSITLSGSIDNTDPLWARPSETCSAEAPADHFFDDLTVTNNTGAAQLITITAAWSGDGFLHAFSDPFDPNSIGSCIIANDDFGGIFGSQIFELPIAAGETIHIIASTFDANAATGGYTMTVSTVLPR